MTQGDSVEKPGLSAAYRQLSLSTKILIWMAIGAAVGLLLGEQATVVRPIGDLFMRLLLMAAIPLIFFNLISGICSLRDAGSLGKLGVRTILYYVASTCVALTIGFIVATLIQPGTGVLPASAPASPQTEVPGFAELVLDMVPSNIAAAFAEGNVVQVVVVAIFLGITALLLPDPQREQLQDGFALISDLLKKLVGLILVVSPFGIGALVAASIGEYGGALFGPLAKFLVTIWSAQLLMVAVYLAFLRLTTGRSIAEWLRATGPLYATTAATCSSLASLVVAMEVARKRVRLPENVFSFTLPLGTQLNKDGTSITLIVVLLFTIQAVGFDTGFADVLAMIAVGVILSQGSGGIPQGGLILAFIYVESFGLPLELAGILVGVYRLIDMGNTTVNCMGDMTWTTVVADLTPSRTPEAA